MTAATVSFGPVEIRYDERVLTPRRWTLLQSRWAAELAGSTGSDPLLELFAGAGHIGLAAAALSGRPLIQVEADPVAAAYAAENAGRTELLVEIRVSSIESALSPDERFGLILADPPYLPSADLARWPADPPQAIDGGADGLDLVRSTLRLAERHLRPGGLLLLQVAGAAQADAVARLTSLAHHETRVHDPERAVALFRGAVTS